MKNINNVNIVHHYGDESIDADKQQGLQNKTDKEKVERIHKTFMTLRFRRKGSDVVRYIDDIQNILDKAGNNE